METYDRLWTACPCCSAKDAVQSLVDAAAHTVVAASDQDAKSADEKDQCWSKKEKTNSKTTNAASVDARRTSVARAATDSSCDENCWAMDLNESTTIANPFDGSTSSAATALDVHSTGGVDSAEVAADEDVVAAGAVFAEDAAGDVAPYRENKLYVRA